MIGAIIGDIVGSRFEFNNIKTKEFELVTKDSVFTDDTVLTIALMDWILHSEVKNVETSARYLQKWARKYPYAGYGSRFSSWIYEEDPKPYNSCGNGSAMRISPIAFAYFNDYELEKEMVVKATASTHNHPEGIKGAMVISHCISMARNGCSKEMIKEYALEQYPEIATFDYEELRRTYYHGAEICQESVPQALYCFFISSSVEDCLRTTISIGGDCDTTAAMNTPIAEAYYKDIDPILINKIRDKLPLEMLVIIDEFKDKYGGF